MFAMHHVLELLKKDLFVNIKVICVIMILCKVLSAVVLNRLSNYSFSGGCFCKISVHLLHGSRWDSKDEGLSKNHNLK